MKITKIHRLRNTENKNDYIGRLFRVVLVTNRNNTTNCIFVRADPISQRSFQEIQRKAQLTNFTTIISH